MAGLIPERAIYDFLLTFAFDKMFERFPNLRIASVENGSGFLRDLFVKLEQSRRRADALVLQGGPVRALPPERLDQSLLGGRDDPDVIEHMGADRVIYGSDWPHMEGLERPRDILEDGGLDGISAADQAKILYENTASLNERRPA